MLEIMKASAGSGKTFTLTLKYIKLLLGVKDEASGKYRLAKEEKREYHRHILAVTFTNKATEEMKERIIKELSVLAGHVDGLSSPYMELLCEHFGETPDAICKAASRVLGELLFDYTNFNVSTIDSFFQIILRTFAYELDMPYDYNIELNDKYAMQVGIRDFLASLRHNVLKDNPIVGWLKSYVQEKINDGSGWNIFSSISAPQSSTSDDLFKFAAIINTEKFRSVSADVAEYFSEDGRVGKLQVLVDRYLGRLRESIISRAKEVQRVVNERSLSDLLKKDGLAARIDKFAGGDTIEKDSKANVLKFLSNPDSLLKKGDKKNRALRDGAIAEIEPIINAISADYSRLLLFVHIKQHIYMLGLLGGISGSVRRFSQDNNLILLSDTNELLKRIIKEDDTPFIYERIGVWINNFLVDEFQDTSDLQWQNFKPLLSNSLSSGNYNLVIGDEKQCIYRFRNSNPTLLQYRVLEEFAEREVEVNGERSTNWRSALRVIQFNNTFFTMVSRYLKVGDVYSNVVQIPNKKKRKVAGFVRVEMLDPLQSGKKDANGADDAQADDNMKFTDRVLERLPDELSAILERGYKQSDIAILVNTNIEGARVIKRLLEYNLEEGARRNFKVISSDSLLLKNSPTVRLIISHLRYLGVAVELRDGQRSSRQDTEEKLHRLLRQYENFLNHGHTPEQAMEMAVTSPVSKEQMLGEIDEFVPRDCQCHNLVSVVERIIEKAVSNEARERENPFISALQDYVIEFCSRSSPSIRSFVEWWDRACDKLSITSPAGIDAINVMTIHKSKGLEFPCVLIPFANWEMCKVDSTLWFTKDEIERANVFDKGDASDEIPPLLPVKYYGDIASSALKSAFDSRVNENIVDSLNKTYVAFTRAIDELHIFSERPARVLDVENGDLVKLSLNDCLAMFENDAKVKNVVDELNKSVAEAADGMDVATGINATDTGYTVGEMAANDREPAEPPVVTPMPKYEVYNNHKLAKFILPEVFYTPQRERGILLHKVLSMIRNADDIERCLKYCRVRCVVLPEQYDEIASLVRKMLVQSEEVQRWFARGNKVYNERTIAVGEERYRPDRVVVTPQGETIVIDFKFGNIHSKGYMQQVKHYMALLSEAGLPNVTGRIWYPFEGIVDVVK